MFKLLYACIDQLKVTGCMFVCNVSIIKQEKSWGGGGAGSFMEHFFSDTFFATFKSAVCDHSPFRRL